METEQIIALATVYAPVFGIIAGIYLIRRKIKDREATKAHEEALKSGLSEPSSLHPIIDQGKCLGCGACVKACPEGDVLGLVRNKAELVNASHCIGHGACAAACPFEAIDLVFGTERRGIDIPTVNPDFQTNVPGVFIAGELGGMGLIRNAINQGVQAVENAMKLPGVGKSAGDELDLLIVGAGPAGLAATLAAMEKKLRSVTIEQDTIGGTVAHYPRGKVVMTKPGVLPLVGKFRFRETTKEALVDFWEDVQKKTGFEVQTRERIEKVTQLPDDQGFIVKSSKSEYKTKAVLLAIGRRGTPRKLGCKGEEQTKVVYRLTDPEQYRGQQVLVVGGGDSALEAAYACADEPGTKVILSYRGASFNRAKPKNREIIAEYAKRKKLQVFYESQVKEIKRISVVLNTKEGEKEFKNDAVIVNVGGVLPTDFLRSIGIVVETKYGTK